MDVAVVDDSISDDIRRRVSELGSRLPLPVRYLPRNGPPGINAARNTGIDGTDGELIVFLDDDCRVPESWLTALCAGVDAAPDADAFGGPIALDLDEHPRWCGDCPFPVTTLDRGPSDRWVDVVYGANMAIRRSAAERVGPFDEGFRLHGDEIEWQLRLRRDGGLVRYVAGARVLHSREPEDVTLRALVRSAYQRGRGSERLYGAGPSPNRARVAARVPRRLGHALRRGCLIGVVNAAGALGALTVAMRPGTRRHEAPSG